MRLTDIAVKNAKPSDKQIKLSDGKGCICWCILMAPNTGKRLIASMVSKKSFQLAPTLLYRSQKLVQAS